MQVAGSQGASPGGRAVQVRAGGASYSVRVGSGLLGLAGPACREMFASSQRAFVIADAGVPGAIVDGAAKSLADVGFGVGRTAIASSEQAKSLETLGVLLGELLASGHERSDPVVAIGGGIAGDVAGFAAASYRRGCPVVQCPTTLLSMVDASVGGKTGVNLVHPGTGRLLKNMVGAFHQPSLVLADTDALASLPDRVYRSGLGECVKHAMLSASFGDPELLGWTERNAAAIARRDPAIMPELIARNVSVKAAVVATDERETASSDGRALLNLGHTFAHAIETIGELSPTGRPEDAPLMHGEAVALGLIAACEAGSKLGLTAPGLTDRVRTLLKTLGLPTGIAGLPDAASILEDMRADKKARGGKLRIVVPTTTGVCATADAPPEATLIRGLSAIRLRP